MFAADWSCVLDTSVTLSSLKAHATTSLADAKGMPSMRKKEREKGVIDTFYHIIIYYQPRQVGQTMHWTCQNSIENIYHLIN